MPKKNAQDAASIMLITKTKRKNIVTRTRSRAVFIDLCIAPKRKPTKKHIVKPTRNEYGSISGNITNAEKKGANSLKQKQGNYQDRLRQYEAAKQRLIASGRYADARDLERQIRELAKFYKI